MLNERHDVLNIASLEGSSQDLHAEWLTEVGRPAGSRNAGMRATRGGSCENIKEKQVVVEELTAL